MEASSLLILQSALETSFEESALLIETTYDLQYVRKLIQDFVSAKLGPKQSHPDPMVDDDCKLQQIPDGMSFLRLNVTFMNSVVHSIIAVFPEGTFDEWETRWRELRLTWGESDGNFAEVHIEEEPSEMLGFINKIASYFIPTDVIAEECMKEIGLYFSIANGNISDIQMVIGDRLIPFENGGELMNATIERENFVFVYSDCIANTPLKYPEVLMFYLKSE